ncbi:MAG: ATP phosphoribosyltransferase regulatory subunit [Myxococcota bacterium]
MNDSIPDGARLVPMTALPRGATDRLPAACRRRRAVTATLLATVEAWGYEPVATPALEYYDVLARGLSDDDRRGCVRFIAAGSGELVTLRADVTPQIARMVAQRWGAEIPADMVHRFSYAAEVLRQPTTGRERSEVHQVGIELLGDDDPAADAEIVALADAALRAVGLPEFRLDLAHTRVARGLWAALDLPEAVQVEAHARLARKDRDGLAALLDALDRPATLRQAPVALCDLFGPPGAVLPRAEAALAGTGVEPALTQLRAVLDHLQAFDGDVLDRVTLDLGEARGFDYYSGLRVRGWARGVRHPLVRGGRYDGLPRRYGVPRPATGFAIELDAVEAALAAFGVTVAGAQPPAAHLVAVAPTAGDAAARDRAQAHAQRARAAGQRAWIQPAVSLGQAQALADRAGARALTFIDEQQAGRWTHGSQGWARTEETT